MTKSNTTISEISLKRTPSEFQKIIITNSQESADYIRQFYFDDITIYESVFLLLLDRQNKTIGYAKISQGGITGAVVDIKIVCKYIVDSLASGAILCHNHPSGNLVPSTADIEITKKIVNILKLMNSQLMDHIILTENSFYSFADNELM